MSRQTELIKEPKSKVRGVELAKSTRTGSSLPRRRTAVCYEVSPEIRSVREGRIRPGSVAPLLSRRAKALAMVRKSLNFIICFDLKFLIFIFINSFKSP